MNTENACPSVATAQSALADGELVPANCLKLERGSVLLFVVTVFVEMFTCIIVED